MSHGKMRQREKKMGGDEKREIEMRTEMEMVGMGRKARLLANAEMDK